MATRRRFLALAAPAALALSGCGWTPLYADRQATPADAALRAIRVDPIPERIGQRLEMALRESFNPAGVPTPQRYVLHTTLVVSRSDLGIQQQGLGTRARVDATATYVLADLRSGKPLFTGTTHVAESFDIVPNEYAALVAEDDARKRAAEELRAQILTQLTLFLQHRAAEAAAAPAAIR